MRSVLCCGALSCHTARSAKKRKERKTARESKRERVRARESKRESEREKRERKSKREKERKNREKREGKRNLHRANCCCFFCKQLKVELPLTVGFVSYVNSLNR